LEPHIFAGLKRVSSTDGVGIIKFMVLFFLSPAAGDDTAFLKLTLALHKR